MNKAIIIGAGTHGEIYSSYLKSCGIDLVGFIDDDLQKQGHIIRGLEVIGTYEDLFSKKFKNKITDIYCPVGDNMVRKEYLSTLKNEGYETPNFIHPSVILAPDVSIGEAIYILQGNFVMPFTTIGNYFMMNMGCTIGHHVTIGEGVFISSGARIGASMKIADYAYFGTGCTVKTGVESIGTSALIGAGAVVIKNVADDTVVAGNPAKEIKSKKNLLKPPQPSKITEITSKSEWNNVLKEVDEYDFYHTYDYHLLSKNEDESAVLLVYRNMDSLIAIPLVIRPIFNTEFFDVTSVYGYPGPISKNITDAFDNAHFKAELDNYFKEHNIIAAFSRLNPYIKQQKNILLNIGECVDKSAVVAINLTNDLETQRLGYQRRIKTQINKARRLCNIVKATNKEEIDAFINIYYENMNRVGAEYHYYFTREYFYDFLNSSDFETDLLLAITKDTKEIIAGVMFVKTNRIVQYHLVGTKSEFLHLNPVKILIDEMRLLATKEGLSYLNLGGGLGSTDDSLLRFKMSFSKELKTFCIWKHIINEEVYNILTSKHCMESNDFFPAYRTQ